MSKRSECRRLRKLRRQIGKPPQPRLAMVLIDADGVSMMTRDSHVSQYNWSGIPKLDHARRERLKYDLLTHGFVEMNDETLYMAPGITIKDACRLLPWAKIRVTPKTRHKETKA